MVMTEKAERLQPPPEVVRALPELTLEDRDEKGSIATVFAPFAVFGPWADIESVYEGRFKERMVAGSFLETMQREKDRYRVQFEHGRDPTIARKVLGPVIDVGEDERSAYYRFALMDTAYNRELLPGLEAGQYGSSFRGRFAEDSWDDFPEASEHNPERLPERTVSKVESLRDFGPCTFPAYLGTTATVQRSMTDEFLIEPFTHGEGLRKLAEYARTLTPGTEEKPKEKPKPIEKRFVDREEWLQWISKT